MIYISYHNKNIEIATQTALSLKEHGIQVWFDRHEIPLYSNRGRFLVDAITGASFALVFLSNKYLSTSYCMQELELLTQHNISILAILLDDIELASIGQSDVFLELLDIQNMSLSKARRSIHQQLLVHTGKTYKTTIAPERLLYIFNLINDMEIKLSQTITISSLNNRGETDHSRQNSIQTRTPGYVSSLVKEGSFSLTIDNESLALKNLLSLLEIQPFTLLSGASGSGKSTIGWLVALHKAHDYRLTENASLPVYLDCSLWREEQSFAEFFSDCWQLALDWRTWISKYPTFFIVDIDEFAIQAHPDYLKEIDALCLSSEQHACLLITSVYDKSLDSKMSVAHVSTGSLNDNLIKEFADTLLLDAHAKPFFDWYKTIEDDRLERQIDYVSFVIEYLNSRDEVDYNYPIQHLTTRIIHQRWQELTHNIDMPVSYAEFHSNLTFIAWSMLCSKNSYYMLYSDVLNHIGDSTIIELGIELDVFEVKQDFLRFTSRLIQDQLAAYMLLDDGVYKHLRKPIFDDAGQRIEDKWESVFLALFEITDEEQYDELIELIDDVNPFLAVEFARRDKALLKQYLLQLIGKLLDIRRKNPLAHQALRQTLMDLPYTEEIALYLVRLMDRSDWQTKDILYDYLKNLRPIVPENLIQDVHHLERHFHDSRRELLSNYPLEQWVIYGNQLTNHPDPAVRRNTISLLGESKYLSVLPVVCSGLESASDSIFSDSIEAISWLITEDGALDYFLQKLPEERFDCAVISELFTGLNRPLSAYLANTINVIAPDMTRSLCFALAPVEETVVVSIIARQLQMDDYLTDKDDSNELRSDNVMKLIELTRKIFRNIDDRDMLEQVFTDVTGVFNKMDNVSETDSHSSTPEDKQSIPRELLDTLSSEDWVTRYQALQELMDYPDAVISPYLIQIAGHDEDVQVRMTALDIVTHLEQTDEIRDCLINALEDEDSLVIDQVTDYIKGLEEFDASTVIHLLKHSSPQTIVATIEILTRHRHPDVVNALGKLLSDDRIPWLSEDSVAHYAAGALKAIGTKTALQYLEQAGFNKLDEAIIEPGIEYKEKYSIEQKVMLTLIAIRNDEWDLSQKAARYLRKLAKSLRGTKNQVVISALEDALDDDLWTLRWAVVEALAWIKSPTSIPKVNQRLFDANWMVQVAAIRSLIELEAKDSAPDIARLLPDTNSAVAEAAAEALGLLNNLTVIHALEKSLCSEDEFVRLATLKSILQLLEEGATPFMLFALNDPYNHIRWFAMKYLSEVAGEEHLPAIVELLPDRSRPAWEKVTISDYALLALKHINSAKSRSIIEEWTTRKL